MIIILDNSCFGSSMIVDEEAFNNSDFTLMATDEIASIADDKEVTKILKKYNISQTKNQLNNSNELLHIKLIQHVDNIYYLNQEVPEDIASLIKTNGTYKTHLVENIKKRLKSLLTDGSAIFFKEIISVINLLSLGEKFTIFKTYNEYDFEEVSKLFRLYETHLQDAYYNDRFNFESTFECYLSLIKSYSQLCIINATDVNRKKTINPIINAITETINMLKFTVALEEVYLNKLNNLLGEVLYYFSHLPYIDAKDKELYYLIDEFYLLLEKQTDGYNLSKDAEFGGEKDEQRENFLIFLNNSGYLLLTMIQKLKHTFANKDYFNTRSFQKCLRLFSENFPVMHVVEGEETLESFNIKLLNTIVQNYTFEDDITAHNNNYQMVIDDFIQTADNFNIQNIETIHNVLLFARDIDDYKYLNIGETLLHSSLIQNDYYEFFKLKTIDIVINYFIKNKSKENTIPFIKHVEFYVDNNKKASHLLSMYSKLNLSMAHYYALREETEAIHKAKSLYSTFINTNGVRLLQNEYAQINDDVLSCLGKYYVQDLELNPEKFTQERLIKLGKKLSQSYIGHLDLKTKYTINDEFADIISTILNKENMDYEAINEKVSNIIANKIFYGLCDVRIKGLTKQNAKIIDNGYMLFSMPMLNSDAYVLQFIFPAVYEEEFKYILKENKEFLSKNINNILSSFKRNAATLIDDISGLDNVQKLKNDLAQYGRTNILFIEILLGGLSIINKKYGFTMGNNFLRAISKKLSSLLKKDEYIYYLNGGRIAIITDINNDYSLLLKNIENIKIKKDGENVDMKLTIAVTQANATNVLEESSKLLDKALTSQSKILFNIK